MFTRALAAHLHASKLCEPGELANASLPGQARPATQACQTNARARTQWLINCANKLATYQLSGEFFLLSSSAMSVLLIKILASVERASGKLLLIVAQLDRNSSHSQSFRRRRWRRWRLWPAQVQLPLRFHFHFHLHLQHLQRNKRAAPRPRRICIARHALEVECLVLCVLRCVIWKLASWRPQLRNIKASQDN